MSKQFFCCKQIVNIEALFVLTYKNDILFLELNKYEKNKDERNESH